MATFYLDTSAVLKRYRTETGTDVVEELYEGRASQDSLITSLFTCLEFESVVIRALKGKLLTQEAYDARSHGSGVFSIRSPMTRHRSSGNCELPRGSDKSARRCY